MRELLCSVPISVGAAAWVRSWRRLGGRQLLSVSDCKVLKTLSLTMVDESDVLLVCGGEALILLMVCGAGRGRAVALLNAEHYPGCREAEGTEMGSHSLLMYCDWL